MEPSIKTIIYTRHTAMIRRATKVLLSLCLSPTLTGASRTYTIAAVECDVPEGGEHGVGGALRPIRTQPHVH